MMEMVLLWKQLSDGSHTLIGVKERQDTACVIISFFFALTALYKKTLTYLYMTYKECNLQK